MSSWIMHLRIGELFARWVPIECQTLFYVGCIAPDSGVPNPDSVTYQPPKNISHWQDEQHRSLAEDFFSEYVQNAPFPSRAFYLGYYIHLATDELWKTHVFRPNRDFLLREGVLPGEITAVSRSDWKRADTHFLRSDPDYQPYLILKDAVGFQNTYLPYFPPDAIARKIDEIASCFDGDCREDTLSFRIFGPQDADKFVRLCADKISVLLQQHDVVPIR